jgi:integrase
MKFVSSPKTGVISVVIRTDHGTRSISTGCTNQKDAAAVAKLSKIKELELAGKAARLTAVGVNQILAGKKITIEFAVQQWQEWMSTSIAPKTALNYTVTVNSWIKERHLSGRLLHTIKAKDIDAWLNDPKSEAKASTRSVLFAAIRSFFKLAHARGYLIGNPAGEVRIRPEMMSHEQKERQKGKPFSASAFASLMAWYDRRIKELESALSGFDGRIEAAVTGGHSTQALKVRRAEVQARLDRTEFWRMATMIGRHAGLRLGDICCMERASLQKAGRAVVWTDKTNARVDVPVSDSDTVALLNDLAVGEGRYCFQEVREDYQHYGSRAYLSREFTSICEQAGVSGHSFHDLRHTHATELRKSGKSIRAVGKRLGHANTATTEIYVHD